MSHLDRDEGCAGATLFPSSSGAECLQGVPTSPARVHRRLSLPAPRDSRPHGTGLRLAWCNTARWEELWTWCKSYEHAVRLSPQKIPSVNSLSSRLTPVKSAEIFVIFKRSKIRIKTFCFFLNGMGYYFWRGFMWFILWRKSVLFATSLR